MSHNETTSIPRNACGGICYEISCDKHTIELVLVEVELIDKIVNKKIEIENRNRNRNRNRNIITQLLSLLGCLDIRVSGLDMEL